MIKTLLVPVTGGDSDEIAAAAALTVARAFAAHIDFLHVQLDPGETATVMAAEGASGPMVIGLFDQFAAGAAAREQRAESFFQSFCRRANLPFVNAPPASPAPSARWLRQLGPEPYWVAAYGRAADLIVIARPDSEDGLVPTMIETALLDSGRPILVPGPAAMAELPQTVLVGWKPVREAAHALAAALPFLRRARDVVLLSVSEEQDDADPQAAARAAEGLAWHGVSAALLSLAPGPEGAAETLLAAAAERQALLVIGGYSRSRLREAIFGGVTRHVLQAAPVPILIAH